MCVLKWKNWEGIYVEGWLYMWVKQLQRALDMVFSIKFYDHIRIILNEKITLFDYL